MKITVDLTQNELDLILSSLSVALGEAMFFEEKELERDLSSALSKIENAELFSKES